MANWDKPIDVVCPSCGKRRILADRGRGSIRPCRSCSIRSGRIASRAGITHGESKSPLYRVWSAMIQRCELPTNECYRRYGGRGITICPEWHDYVPFRDWALVHGYRKGLYLDRENNDGNYEPGNCRWVTSAVSAYNRPTTKIKAADVAVIRELTTAGLTCRFVAAFYGVNERRVSDIKLNKKYRWVDPAMVAGW